MQNGAHARGIGRFCNLRDVCGSTVPTKSGAPHSTSAEAGGGAPLIYIYIIYANALKQMFLLDLGTSVGVIRFQRQRRRVSGHRPAWFDA